LLCLKTNCN